jgi:Tol biopolymer transport system component
VRALQIRPSGLAALALGAIAAALVSAGSATAKVQNGSVAFAGDRGASRAVYLRAPSGRLRVFPTLGRAADPAFSPLGRRLAFTRRGGAGAQVWLSYLDGTGRRPLTAGPADTMPEWSPSADQIAFVRGRYGRRDIYRVGADGNFLTRLTLYAGDDHSPTWSITNRIAFIRRLGRKTALFVIPASGGSARRLTRSRMSEASPAWSPTGRTLLVARGAPGRRDLYLLRANGTHPRRLTKIRGDESEGAWSPDGSRIAFTYRRGSSRRLYIMKVRGKAISKLPARSRRVRRLTTSRSRSATPSWQTVGADPVVAAAGDIACDPDHPSFEEGEGSVGACRQQMTANLLKRLDLSAVLVLGDAQYENGTLAKFRASFDPSWGQFKTLIRPIPGNHEYLDPGAAGYFDYFNGPGVSVGPAGERGKGYYSYDLGSWHIVAINSECSKIGGCGPGSPEQQWLLNDLAAHPSACTLAYWHEPRFTSGRHPARDQDSLPLWTTLYAAHADVILNGHEHFYERFAPQNPAGVADPALGIRQITAGMGGRSHHELLTPAANSERRDNTTTGVLKLTLGEGRYDWQLLRAPTGGAVDAGSDRCR